MKEPEIIHCKTAYASGYKELTSLPYEDEIAFDKPRETFEYGSFEQSLKSGFRRKNNAT